MHRAVTMTLCLLAATSAFAQAVAQDEPPEQTQTPVRPIQAGRVADSSVGEVGQRQTREGAAAEAGITPMARIASRIQNRVQSRIRNRIDRDYDPQANATNPFEAAEEETRSAGRPR